MSCDFRLTESKIRSKIQGVMTKVCSKLSLFTAWGLFSVASIVLPVEAQTIPESELAKLPAEVAAQLEHVSVKDILTGKIKTRSTLPETQEKDPDWVSPLPVTLHLRGSSGSSLPNSQTLLTRKMEAAKKMPPPESNPAPLLEKATKDFFNRVSKIEKLPSCHSDKKKFTPFATATDNNLWQDLLFIDPEQAPMDSDEAFGKDTLVIKYSEKGSRSWIHFATLEEIKCLPSRIRIFGNGVYHLEGLPALRNFENDNSGEGILTDAMKSKVHRLPNEPEEQP